MNTWLWTTSWNQLSWYSLKPSNKDLIWEQFYAVAHSPPAHKFIGTWHQHLIATSEIHAVLGLASLHDQVIQLAPEILLEAEHTPNIDIRWGIAIIFKNQDHVDLGPPVPTPTNAVYAIVIPTV